MAKKYDLTGKRFNRLFVVSLKSKGKHKMWNCLCDCGNHIEVSTSHLLSGHTQSCGCKNRDNTIRRNTKHGLRKHRLYTIWARMRQRCFDKNDKSYIYYGERGITVCDEWHNDFMAFYSWAMNNGYSDILSIDRIDPNGNYYPENCRWITHKEQQRNKTNNRPLTAMGETKLLCDWSRITGIKQVTISRRLKLGWSIERAVSTPLRGTE